MSYSLELLKARREVEINFWRDAPEEKPGVDSVDNFLDKCADALILREAIRSVEKDFQAATNAVELGGGQGWGSCLVKRLFPELHVIATDISPYAISSVPRWEKVFNVKLDGTQVCTSDRLSMGNESADLIFCFAAAHHFVTHDETLAELNRVLRPGGTIHYFYEPTSPAWLYKLAVRRVNRKRPDVPEDVLVPYALRRTAQRLGLSFTIRYWPSTLKRAPMTAVYYGSLYFFPILNRILPCTANMTFKKSS
jgi:ubiquinone/menaquinone biosynthesis C-methylase UbiE